MKFEKWADLAGVIGRLNGRFQAAGTEGCSALWVRACECSKSILPCVPAAYLLSPPHPANLALCPDCLTWDRIYVGLPSPTFQLLRSRFPADFWADLSPR